MMGAGCLDARVEVETVGRASEQTTSTNASGVFYHLWQQASARQPADQSRTWLPVRWRRCGRRLCLQLCVVCWKKP